MIVISKHCASVTISFTLYSCRIPTQPMWDLIAVSMIWIFTSNSCLTLILYLHYETFSRETQHHSNTDGLIITARSHQRQRLASYLLVPSSETMPSPSALFCLSKAFRSRTLRQRARLNWTRRSPIGQGRSQSNRGQSNEPARLHQRLETQEEAHVLLVPQILQHFLEGRGRTDDAQLFLLN